MAAKENEFSTRNCWIRLQKELMALMMSTEKSVSAFPENENFFRWIGTITGEDGTLPFSAVRWRNFCASFKVRRTPSTMDSVTACCSSSLTPILTRHRLFTSWPNVSIPTSIWTALCASTSWRRNGRRCMTSARSSCRSSRFSASPTTRARWTVTPPACGPTRRSTRSIWISFMRRTRTLDRRSNESLAKMWRSFSGLRRLARKALNLYYLIQSISRWLFFYVVNTFSNTSCSSNPSMFINIFRSISLYK